MLFSIKWKKPWKAIHIRMLKKSSQCKDKRSSKNEKTRYFKCDTED